MGVDERLFGWLHRGVSAWLGREAPEKIASSVDAAALLPRLRVLAAAGADAELDVRLVDGDGGVAGSTVLLPRRFAELPTRGENERALLVRATLAGAVASAKLEPNSASLSSALPSIENRLREELPGWGALRDALPASLSSLSLVGKLYPAMAADPQPSKPGEAVQKLPSGVTTERKARQRGPLVRKRTLPEAELPENPFTHSFEKVHTAEEYKGGSKRADGSDELSEQLAALDELDLSEVVESSQSTQSVYQADALFTPASADGEAAAGHFNYDEWDVVRRRYLAQHCAVTVETVLPCESGGVALRKRVTGAERRAIAETRAQLLRLETARRWHTRQPDGTDIDLDALIDRRAALCAGQEGPTKLYASRRRRGTSLALLLLVDASMSTDGWVANRRVIEVEREAAAIVALALEGLPIELSMAAFCSFSRADCRFLPLKGQADPLAVGLDRLAALEPRGYTRVGPALRHGVRVLDASAARRRVLVLLSDGKPTDTDVYEGRHGMGDVRQAVREASQKRVDVFAISADPRSRAILPQMFGTHGHAGLDGPGDIARAVGCLVTRITR